MNKKIINFDDSEIKNTIFTNILIYIIDINPIITTALGDGGLCNTRGGGHILTTSPVLCNFLTKRTIKTKLEAF